MSTLLLALSLIGVPAKLTPLSSTAKEVWAYGAGATSSITERPSRYRGSERASQSRKKAGTAPARAPGNAGL